jgi:NAD(P)-dependent dehydrogenase (short-subunit alcohol dehydrogenase family)
MRSDGGRTVLVAGGTRGIGRAIGLAFARRGERVFLTHRWGSVDAAQLRKAFEADGATVPEVVEADVAQPSDTRALLEQIGAEGVDVFVYNVCVVGRGTGTIAPRDLHRSLEYSAWPLLRYLDAMQETFGALPRYVVATSSDGPDRFYPGYDYVAAAKSVLESLCRMLAARHPSLRINALRARQVDTVGYREMFGPDARDAVARFSQFDVDPQEVGDAAVALCSGDLDGLSGEVITLDRGAGPIDNLMNIAPTLLSGSGSWEKREGGPTGSHPRGVLWIDAGVVPEGADLGRPTEVVAAEEAGSLDPGRLPDCVVVGCDWRDLRPDETESSALLPELLGRAAAQGAAPRYGLRVDRGVEPPAAGEALARTLDRYWGSWHVGTESRVNAVRYVDDRHHPQAVSAVRALLSGSLEGLRGQLLSVTRGPTR